jgi:hypothetical protein
MKKLNSPMVVALALGVFLTLGGLILYSYQQGFYGYQQSLPATGADIAHGVYVADPDRDLSTLDNYNAMVGSNARLVVAFSAFQDENRNYVPFGQSTTYFDGVLARGAVPMLTWEPQSFCCDATQPDFTLSQITGGRHDDFIRQYAKDIKAWGKPLYLRFAHEMTSTTYPWGWNVNGNGPGDYIDAWRHVHDIFQAEGATNVKWVWAPTALTHAQSSVVAPYASVYPGDAYVDWTGMSGYNSCPGVADGWLSFSQIFSSGYNQLKNLTSKPMMISEMATSENGGSKAKWITDAYGKIPTNFPEIKAVVWFNTNKECDWRVNSSQTALEAYEQQIGAYTGTMP